jgi:hypothetical protein
MGNNAGILRAELDWLASLGPTLQDLANLGLTPFGGHRVRRLVPSE